MRSYFVLERWYHLIATVVFHSLVCIWEYLCKTCILQIGIFLLRGYSVTNSIYGACRRRIHTCCNLVNITNVYHLSSDAIPFIFIERKAPFTITILRKQRKQNRLYSTPLPFSRLFAKWYPTCLIDCATLRWVWLHNPFWKLLFYWWFTCRRWTNKFSVVEIWLLKNTFFMLRQKVKLTFLSWAMNVCAAVHLSHFKRKFVL
jgi:hypothetical protein